MVTNILIFVAFAVLSISGYLGNGGDPFDPYIYLVVAIIASITLSTDRIVHEIKKGQETTK